MAAKKIEQAEATRKQKEAVKKAIMDFGLFAFGAAILAIVLDPFLPEEWSDSGEVVGGVGTGVIGYNAAPKTMWKWYGASFGLLFKQGVEMVVNGVKGTEWYEKRMEKRDDEEELDEEEFAAAAEEAGITPEVAARFRDVINAGKPSRK